MCKEEHILIPVRVIKTLFLDGYFAEFWVNVQNGLNHRESYEKLEQDLEKYHLPPRYDNYESFKAMKYQYYRRKTGAIEFW